MVEIAYSQHSVGESNHHLQFTPKYRRRVFSDEEIRATCERLAYEKAEQLGVSIGAINFGPDHMHLFVTGCRRYSVSQLVQYFKGYIAYHIRQECMGKLQPYLWGDSFWSDGYFYESVGRVTAESAEFYIKRQQGKHWANMSYDVYTARVVKKQKKIDEFFAS